jgi:hypothetical protein
MQSRLKSNLQPVPIVKGRLPKLKKNPKLPKLSKNTIVSSLMKDYYTLINLNKKSNTRRKPKTKRVVFKSPVMRRRNINSLSSNSRKTRVMSQTRGIDPSFGSKSPEAEGCRFLLNKLEEKMWTSVYSQMTLSMNQKVDNTRRSRFIGFCSPTSLRNKVNDIRMNKTMQRSHSELTDTDEKVVDLNLIKLRKIKMNFSNIIEHL